MEHRIERHVVKRKSKYGEILNHFSHLTNNLYNHANFDVTLLMFVEQFVLVIVHNFPHPCDALFYSFDKKISILISLFYLNC